MSEKEVLLDSDLGIRYKKTADMLVAGIAFKGGREDIPGKIEQLRSVCGDKATGNPIVLFDYGVYSDGPEIEVCLPVGTPIDEDDVRSRVLSGREVVSIMHRGPREKVRDTMGTLLEYMRSRAMVLALPVMEVTIEPYDPEADKYTVEIQVPLHHWGRRLVDAIDEVLGPDRRGEIVDTDARIDDPGVAAEERFDAVKSIMGRLEKAIDANQKYRVLSCCSDVFSQKRIDHLRNVYLETGSVDAVIAEQSKDFAWYEAPRRKGSVIYVTKTPYNKEAHDKAATREEKRKYYCHCILVRNRLDEGMPVTYCYCGTGWYRQQWEGILQRPVRIELLKSLLKGDDTCEFAIHLPEDVLPQGD